MRNVALHNLGCKVNSYEMDFMQQKLEEKGYKIVPFDSEADVYIVNTCTVTNIADRKSRQMLHRAKAKNPRAVVVAVGCYVQVGGEKALEDECIDLAIGNNRKKDLVEILEAYLAEREQEYPKNAAVIDINRRDCEYEEMTLRKTADHTRAYIKIQDGCNQFCSYCIIPYARGRVRSRQPEKILEEIRGLVAAGYQEVVLTGIHISSYGVDFRAERPEAGAAGAGNSDEAGRQMLETGGIDLIGLVERIHEIEGLRRIRLGSLEPRIITEENVKRLASLEKLCPHFHLSLQSGCDDTLKRMNRHYTSEEYYERVKLLRSAFSHPAITTDVIVGFPGETEEEFAGTRRFLERVGFYEMHIFKYSRRRGTRAADMPDQVPESLKNARSAELFSLEREQSREFRSYYIGKEAEVLFEETKEIGGRRFWLGHTGDYVRIALETEENLSNCMKKVEVAGFLTDEIMISDSMH